jgi:hypothetical protein
MSDDINVNELVGRKYVFPDGNSIEVRQIKLTDEDRGGHLVTYHIQQGPGIPQKLVMPIGEFMGTYGHLFK